MAHSMKTPRHPSQPGGNTSAFGNEAIDHTRTTGTTGSKNGKTQDCDDALVPEEPGYELNTTVRAFIFCFA